MKAPPFLPSRLYPSPEVSDRSAARARTDGADHLEPWSDARRVFPPRRLRPLLYKIWGLVKADGGAA